MVGGRGGGGGVGGREKGPWGLRGKCIGAGRFQSGTSVFQGFTAAGQFVGRPAPISGFAILTLYMFLLPFWPGSASPADFVRFVVRSKVTDMTRSRSTACSVVLWKPHLLRGWLPGTSVNGSDGNNERGHLLFFLPHSLGSVSILRMFARRRIQKREPSHFEPATHISHSCSVASATFSTVGSPRSPSLEFAPTSKFPKSV